MTNKKQSAGSAERALQDLGAAAAADITALMSTELDRCRDAVRKALEQAIGGSTAATKAGVVGFVDRFVAAAAAASDAAAQSVRAEIQLEVDKVQAALSNVRSELEKTRGQVESTKAAIEVEKAARAKAETAAKDGEQARQTMMSGYEAEAKKLRAQIETHRSEIAGLRQQVETEKSERVRMVSAIQQLVNPGTGAAPVVLAAVAPANGKSSAPSASAPAPAPAPERRTESAAPSLPPIEDPEPDPQLRVYVQHLFATMESMYSSDVSKGRRSDELVSCLTQYLQSARTVFQNHVGTSENGELEFFDRHLSELIDEETPFARHLGMAAYECSKAERT